MFCRQYTTEKWLCSGTRTNRGGYVEQHWAFFPRIARSETQPNPEALEVKVAELEHGLSTVHKYSALNVNFSGHLRMPLSRTTYVA